MNIYLKRIYDLDFDYNKPEVAKKFLKSLKDNNRIFPYAARFCEIMDKNLDVKEIEILAEQVPMIIPKDIQDVVEYFIDNLKYYEHAGLCKFNNLLYLTAENRYEYLLHITDDELEKTFYPNNFSSRKEYISSIVDNSVKFNVDISAINKLYNGKVYGIDNNERRNYCNLDSSYQQVADVYISNCLQKSRNA